MREAEERFRRLREEIQKEAHLDPQDRNQDHKKLTLGHFMKCGRSKSDHDLWRESHMPKEILAIIDQRFYELNPHKRSQAEILAIQADASHRNNEAEKNGIGDHPSISDTQWKPLYDYEQSVDEEGRTQKEFDDSATTLYPDLSRQDAELLAAEHYLLSTRDIKQTPPKSQPKEKCAVEETEETLNPMLSWKELLAELEREQYGSDAVKEAVSRCIREWNKKRDPPWPIKGCAESYEVADFQIRANKDIPTPAYCKYRKISRDKPHGL